MRHYHEALGIVVGVVESRMQMTTTLFICDMAPTHRVIQKQMEPVDVPDAPECVHHWSMTGRKAHVLIQVTLG